MEFIISLKNITKNDLITMTDITGKTRNTTTVTAGAYELP